MNGKNPIEIFKKEAPKVANAFDNLISELIQMKGLDEKTKHFIYIGIKVAQGDFLAVKFHVPMAKKLGATRDEIKSVILLTLTVSGLKGITSCLGEALKIFDATE
ncbi:MAG: hypothetical protein K940chlam5_00176 [Candidatus Anoxychlamydiales bacterium]|nr:hypothetical protein [Candidatus Anoxychlamydiales bacterium]